MLKIIPVLVSLESPLLAGMEADVALDAFESATNIFLWFKFLALAEVALLASSSSFLESEEVNYTVTITRQPTIFSIYPIQLYEL